MAGIENVNFANFAKPIEEAKLDASPGTAEEPASIMAEEFETDGSVTKVYSGNASIDEQEILDALNFAELAQTIYHYDKDGNLLMIENVRGLEKSKILGMFPNDFNPTPITELPDRGFIDVPGDGGASMDPGFRIDAPGDGGASMDPGFHPDIPTFPGGKIIDGKKA